MIGPTDWYALDEMKPALVVIVDWIRHTEQGEDFRRQGVDEFFHSHGIARNRRPGDERDQQKSGDSGDPRPYGSSLIPDGLAKHVLEKPRGSRVVLLRPSESRRCNFREDNLLGCDISHFEKPDR